VVISGPAALVPDLANPVCHSKLNGDGYVDSPEKMGKIIAAVTEVIENAQK
jgi:hypothetical protein